MDSGQLATLAGVGAVAVLALAALFVALAGQARLRRDLRSTREEVTSLRRSAQPARPPAARPVPGEYLITTAGLSRESTDAAQAAQVEPVSASRFASLAAGESLVRLVSLGHGVRRALSPESRNRIRFEMRREVRRSRKQRRRELKEAKRTPRADVDERPAA